MHMFSLKNVAIVAAAALVFAGLSLAADKPTPVKATNTWSGSIDDEKLKKEMPENGVITNAKDLEKLNKSWKFVEKLPEINFDKEIVVVATGTGGKLTVNAMLDDKGDLKTLGLETRDLKPGFRYVIMSLPKEGVKTVNSKELPK
jgi:hypothetical protein